MLKELRLRQFRIIRWFAWQNQPQGFAFNDASWRPQNVSLLEVVLVNSEAYG